MALIYPDISMKLSPLQNYLDALHYTHAHGSPQLWLCIIFKPIIHRLIKIPTALLAVNGLARANR